MEQNKKPKLTFKRRLIQLYAALLTNANIKGFATGSIFKGNTKAACVPGLNCYSCPGAVGACPIGSLQNALSEANRSVLYYMFGILLLYSIMFGRWICGFLCPFGLIQDLLHKIKTPKLKKNKVTRVLSYFKYVVLVFFVFIVPLAYMLKDMPLPAFCKYICPAGTLGGAISLLIHPDNSAMFRQLGPLFTWKFALMVSIVVGSVFIYRLFCRFLCPLGALYGLFNKISILGIKLEKNKCINCGLCQAKCKMDIKHVGDHECINCGECISVCPTKAISWKGSKIILPENEIPETATAEEKEVITKKREKRVFVLRIVAAALMVITLAGALIYFNFIHKDTEPVAEEVSDNDSVMLLAADENTEDSDKEYFNIEDELGKVVIINFWGTWCTPCVQELPHFDEIASKYENDVVVVAVHSVTVGGMEPEEYLGKYYPDSKMIFVRDTQTSDATRDDYYAALGGESTYPMTLVLNKYGAVTHNYIGSVNLETLEKAVAEARASEDPGKRVGGQVGKKCPKKDLVIIEKAIEDEEESTLLWDIALTAIIVLSSAALVFGGFAIYDKVKKKKESD